MCFCNDIQTSQSEYKVAQHEYGIAVCHRGPTAGILNIIFKNEATGNWTMEQIENSTKMMERIKAFLGLSYKGSAHYYVASK